MSHYPVFVTSFNGLYHALLLDLLVEHHLGRDARRVTNALRHRRVPPAD